MEERRGFKTYIPSVCTICEEPLNSLRENTLIPVLNKIITHGRFEKISILEGYAHRDCWYLWEHRDVVARKAIEDYQPMFGSSNIIINGEFAVAWEGKYNTSCGGIFLPRSSMIYSVDRGQEVSYFNIVGEIKNIKFILKILTEHDLKPNQIFESTKEFGPKMFIECYDYVDDYYLEVYMHSSSGMDYDCFIFNEDIEVLKEYLKTS